MTRRAGKPWGPGGRRLRCVDEMNPIYTSEELEFMKAMELYMRRNRRPFPDCRDVLLVARALGYRQVCDPEPPPK